jgi:hypothetical protein
MSTVRIESLDARTGGAVVEVWDKGANGQPDTFVEKRLLASPNNLTDLAIGGTRFLVVREARAGEGKTIDNWSTTPNAPPGA